MVWLSLVPPRTIGQKDQEIYTFSYWIFLIQPKNYKQLTQNMWLNQKYATGTIKSMQFINALTAKQY